MFKGKHTWTGFSLRHYDFIRYSVDTLFDQVQGVYILAKQGENEEWIPVHVGETENIQTELTTKFRQPHIDAGATEIHIRRMKSDTPAERACVVKDIREMFYNELVGTD